MSKISADVQEFIKAIQKNDSSVVERLRLIDLDKETTPLYMLINLRHWEGLQYAACHTNHIEILLRTAAYTQWYQAIDFLLPKAKPDEIIEAACVCANANKLEVLKHLTPHCNDLTHCVLPACFSHAQSVLHFLLERGDAQLMREKLKDLSRNNDPNKLSFVYGEKIWGAVNFLRTESMHWELEQATKDCGSSKKTKKI